MLHEKYSTTNAKDALVIMIDVRKAMWAEEDGESSMTWTLKATSQILKSKIINCVDDRVAVVFVGTVSRITYFYQKHWKHSFIISLIM